MIDPSQNTLQIFTILITSHLLGDYLFQFDELYRLKNRRMLGHFIHALIHAGGLLVLFAPRLGQWDLWLFAGALLIVHGAQDVWKYQLDKTCQYPVALYVTDQIFHYAFLLLALSFPFTRNLNSMPDWWKNIFLDSPLVYYFNLLIFSGWALAFLLHVYFRSRHDKTTGARIISTPHLSWGILERFSITLACVAGNFISITLSLLLCATARKFIRRGLYWKDFFPSALASAITGLTLFLTLKVF